MSGTTTPPAPPTLPAVTPALSEPIWAKPSVAIYSLSLFLACLVVALVTKNEQAQLLLIGAVIPMGNTILGYYFGSSSGSTKKTDLMAANPPPAPVPVPAEPAMVTRTTSTSQTTTPIPTAPPTPGPLTP